MPLLFDAKDAAFLKDFINVYGFWWLTLSCMVPMFAFVAYVVWDDARMAKAAKRNGH